MKVKIELTVPERAMIIIALKAYQTGNPIWQNIFDSLADRVGNRDSANDGPEVALLSVDAHDHA